MLNTIFTISRRNSETKRCKPPEVPTPLFQQRHWYSRNLSDFQNLRYVKVVITELLLHEVIHKHDIPTPFMMKDFTAKLISSVGSPTRNKRKWFTLITARYNRYSDVTRIKHQISWTHPTNHKDESETTKGER